MVICREIRVKGKVQGVNFRNHTKQEADRLGIKGTVRNCEDGTVLICAQGEEKSLDEFLKWCCKGPSSCTVVGLDVGETEDRGYTDFKIIR